MAAAIDECRQICRARARNFYYGLKLSPEPQRSALYVIYAWMRLADDLVDAAPPSDLATTRAQIGDFLAATDAALAGRPRADDAIWLALAEVASRFRMTAAHFHSMLDGQVDDLTRSHYATFEDLQTYCYRVASTVGLICIEIWGAEGPAAHDLAINRGVAFQLTNIIRDYKQDFDSGRIYLPLEDFRRHGISPEELRTWSKPSACHAMMKQQIQRAKSFYARSAELDDLITPCCRPTLWAMTSIYRGLLEKMDRNPSRIVLSRRLRLSAIHKGTIAMRAKWQARMAPKPPVQVQRPQFSHVSGSTTAQ